MALRDFWLRTKKRAEDFFLLWKQEEPHNNLPSSPIYNFYLITRTLDDRCQFLLDCLSTHHRLRIERLSSIRGLLTMKEAGKSPHFCYFDFCQDFDHPDWDAFQIFLQHHHEPLWLIVRGHEDHKELFIKRFDLTQYPYIHTSWLRIPCQISTELLAIWEVIRLREEQDNLSGVSTLLPNQDT